MAGKQADGLNTTLLDRILPLGDYAGWWSARSALSGVSRRALGGAEPRGFKETKMRIRTMTTVILAFATIIVVQPASAVCSKASFNGVFGYFHGRPTGTDTFRVVGQITADGNGNVSGSWTLGLSGAISTGMFIGTYTIGQDCTGTLTLSNEDQSPAHFNIVLDDSKQGFQMIQTDSGYDQPGYGIAQGTVACELTGNKQTFATNFLGVLYPSLDIEAIVGQLNLDGKGKITGKETFSVFGVISSAPVTGTYTENSDCTGTIQITPEGSSVTNFNTVTVNSGTELLLIETDNNTFVGGTAQE